MTLEDNQQLANTRHKLGLLEEQIAKAKYRPATAANLESLRSLTSMANQLREEIVRYEAAGTSRRAG